MENDFGKGVLIGFLLAYTQVILLKIMF